VVRVRHRLWGDCRCLTRGTQRRDSHRHLPTPSADGQSGGQLLHRSGGLHSLRWFVNLCRVILAASHWISVPPANGESGAPCIQCLGAPLADTTVAGLIFDGVLFSRRSHRHLRAFCLWSGRRQPPTPTPGSGRLRPLSHRHPCVTTRADGQGGVSDPPVWCPST